MVSDVELLLPALWPWVVYPHGTRHTTTIEFKANDDFATIYQQALHSPGLIGHYNVGASQHLPGPKPLAHANSVSLPFDVDVDIGSWN